METFFLQILSCYLIRKLIFLTSCFISGFKNDVGSSKPIAAVTKPKPVGSGLGSWSMAKSKAPQKKTIPVPRKAPSADLFSTIFANAIDSESAESLIGCNRGCFALVRFWFNAQRGDQWFVAEKWSVLLIHLYF